MNDAEYRGLFEDYILGKMNKSEKEKFLKMQKETNSNGGEILIPQSVANLVMVSVPLSEYQEFKNWKESK